MYKRLLENIIKCMVVRMRRGGKVREKGMQVCKLHHLCKKTLTM